MDKRTRLINALNGGEVDRVPVSFWYHFEGEQAQGEACVQAHLDHYRTTGVDYLKIMSDGYPYRFNGKVERPSDWYHLRPLGKDHPYIVEQVERARRINEALKGECCTFYNIFAPFNSIRESPDSSEAMVAAHIREDEEAVRHGLDVIAEDAATLAELVIREGGCEGIYLALQGAEEDRFPSAVDYRRIVMPSDLKVLVNANRYSDNNIAHLCGWAGRKNRLEAWRDYPAKAFNWAIYIEEMSLQDGAIMFDGKTVIGGFDNRKDSLIVNGSKEAVQAYATALVKSFGKQGLIVGADCTLPNFIDKQRISWVVEAVAQA